MKTEGDRPPSVSVCLFFVEVWMLVEAGGRLGAGALRRGGSLF